MRTTVTLDPDVEKSIRDTCHRTRKNFKQVLNEALRQALVVPSRPRPDLLPPRSMGQSRGHDPARMQELADEMEVNAYLNPQPQA